MKGDQNSSRASSTHSLGSTGTNPYNNTPNSAPKHPMGASTFPAYAQKTWSPAARGTFQPPLTSNNLTEFNATTKTMNGVPSFIQNPATLSTARIRNLPLNTSEEQVRLMTTFVTKDLIEVDILPTDHSDDKGFQTAFLKFKSPSGAQEVKNILDGQPNYAKNANLIVEIVGSTSSGGLGNRYQNDAPLSAGGTATIKIPTGPAAARTPRYNNVDHYKPVNTIMPVNGSVYNGNGNYGHIFSPQSPIGNHLIDRNRMTGKSLIENDDDDTDSILPNPQMYSDSSALQPRRSTLPHLPVNHFTSLSLNTNQAAANFHYGHSNMNPLSALSNHTMSPSAMGPSNPYMPQQQPHRGHNFPAANPADMNPPCNTLYVGNLPIDTSEEELKALFCKQRGYKRLCFRTKQNGPMCFVEFEDISFATKALNELYGLPLHNSTKGGIRLSFSKNPLGVRSGQAPNGPGGNGPNGFTTASGPPPGLVPPPGLGLNRSAYNSSPGLNSGAMSTYTSPTTYTPVQSSGWGVMPANGYQNIMAGPAGNGYADFLAGR